MVDRPHLLLAHQHVGTIFGHRIIVIDPDPEELDIRDVAWSLAHLCRYAGHVSEYFTVAEHSFILSHFVAPADALTALLHDATEAFICDITAPVKQFLPDYLTLEDVWRLAVAKRFGVEEDLHPAARALHTQLGHAEVIRLRPEPYWDIPLNDARKDLLQSIRCWSPVKARFFFLRRYCELTGASFDELNTALPGGVRQWPTHL